MKFRAHEISCPKGEISACRFLRSRSRKGVRRRAPRCSRWFLKEWATVEKEKRAWPCKISRKLRFSSNPHNPTKFQGTYFPGSFDSALQILHGGWHLGYETSTGASLCPRCSWTELSWMCSWKRPPAIVASSGALETPPFELFVMVLEGSKPPEIRFQSKRSGIGQKDRESVKKIDSQSNLRRRALLRVDARHTP